MNMTQEEKARAYDEALEIARRINNGDGVPAPSDWTIPEVIFPVLKESDDEKIRKTLIRFFKDNYYNETEMYDGSVTVGKALDWLEKQSKENMIEALRLEYEKGKADILSEQRKEWSAEDKKIMKALKEGFKYHQLFNPTFGGISCIEIVNWLEKKCEQSCNVSPIDDFATEFEKQVSYIIASSINKENDYTADYVKWAANALLNYAKKELENQEEQTSIDNPKFNVGEWITNDVETVQITGYDIDYGYQVNYKNNLQHRDGDIIENEYHLWTIQDAKDGDVLMSRAPFIYGKQRPYGGLDWYNGKFIKASNFIFKDSPVQPATKEQQNLLFSRMKEAGYEWDDKKKKLKEIHVIDEGKAEMDYCFTKMMNDEKVSSTWSEEDEEFLNRAIKATKSVYPMTANWLKSLKERVQPRQEWNENDEEFFNDTVAFLEIQKNALDHVDWLKSIKNRITNEN